MNDRERKNKSSSPIGKIIGLLLVLTFLPAEAIGWIIVIGIVVLAVYLVIKSARKKGSAPKRTSDKFDDCPKPLRFHKDKGEHYVRRGKEIDPWDRPDIDISKYQHK